MASAAKANASNAIAPKQCFAGVGAKHDIDEFWCLSIQIHFSVKPIEQFLNGAVGQAETGPARHASIPISSRICSGMIDVRMRQCPPYRLKRVELCPVLVADGESRR